MDSTGIYRIFYSNTKKYTFFSAAHGWFSKIDPILGHKINLYKFKMFEMSFCILSDDDAITLKTDNKTIL